MIENYPLVSVIVLTYNSADYILETLFSVYNQTYSNLEIIISDDCSSDETISIVNEWLREHKDRFIRCEVITSEHNLGTAANNNRAIRMSKGEWIRGVAGDDLIPQNAIENQIKYAISNADAKIINGYSVNFKIENGKQVIIPKKKIIEIEPSFYFMDATSQYKYLLTHDNFGLTEGTIVHRSIFEHITMYDEKYSVIEDMPFWLNVTKAGIKYYYLDIPALLYRVHMSIVHPPKGNILNKRFVDIKRAIISDMVKPYIAWYNIKCQERFLIDDLIYWFVFSVCDNRKTCLSRLVLSILYRIRY